jgi:predicted kinase
MEERASEWMYDMVDQALARGEDVVVSDIFLTKASLQPYIELAELYKAELKVLEAKDGTGNIHGVPSETMKAMKDTWEEL